MGVFLDDRPLGALQTAIAGQSWREGFSKAQPACMSLPSAVYTRQGPAYPPRRQVHRLSDSALEIIKDLLSLAGRREQRGEWKTISIKIELGNKSHIELF